MSENPQPRLLPVFSKEDDTWMGRALELAHEAMRLGEVPVGCVILRHGQVVAETYNLTETNFDPTAHAERLALSIAGKSLRNWRLDGCTIYTTLEPCPMCAGAIVQARISRVVYGASDPRAGACRTLYRLTEDRRLNHQSLVEGGLRAFESGKLLSEFFQELRRPG